MPSPTIPDKSVTVTASDRQILSMAFDVYHASLKRRINAEKNQSIKEIVASQLRDSEALSLRF